MEKILLHAVAIAEHIVCDNRVALY